MAPVREDQRQEGDMESPSEVVVSLDQLTFDLSDEFGQDKKDNNESNVIYNKEVSSPTSYKAGDTPFVNLSFILQGTVQENSVKNYEQEDQSKEEMKQEIVEAEDVNTFVEAQVESGTLSNGKGNIVETEPEDFEGDIQSLTMFSSQRNDDSDDSEFEVPEPNQLMKSPEHCDKTEKVVFPIEDEVVSFENNDTLYPQINSENIKAKEIYDVKINASHLSELEPEILTPREKVSSDLHTALLLTDNVINEKSSTLEENQVEIDREEDKERSHCVKPSIVTTAEDWEGVQTVEPGFANSNQPGSGAAPVIESKPLATYSESWEEMAAMDYTSVKSNIKSHVERRGFSAFTHMLFGPPKLHKDLVPGREMVFCIAATPFDNNKEVHNRILQTVYRSLTGSKFDCQRFGGHWEEIGFQGRDPATDLRGTGMLALLHILYFLRDPQTKSLSRDIYKLSLHPTQNFPFCIMSINVTKICLQVLREDVYNKECNKRKDVMGTMNQVYAALFLHLFLSWKKGKTISDSGYVLQEIESYGRKHSKDVFKDLESYEKKKKQEGLFGEHPESDPSFLDVCKEDKCDNKTAAELY